jgi:hypothetical protein
MDYNVINHYYYNVISPQIIKVSKHSRSHLHFYFMGRKQKTSLIFGNKVIYPSIERESFADEQGFRGLFITVYQKPSKGTKAKGIQLELYVDKGEFLGTRMKAKKLVNGKVNGDLPADVSDFYNQLINQKQSIVYDYLAKGNVFEKETIMVSLYGTAFLNKHKKKRTEYITYPVYLKDRIVDTTVIEKKEINELLEDFLKESDVKDLSDLVDSDTGESLIQSEQDAEELIVELKSQKERNLIFLKEKKELELMPVVERYKAGKWNRENIFEFVYSKYYSFSKYWIIKYFFIYRELEKPDEHISKFNKAWIDSFLSFIRKQGFKREFQLEEINPFKSNLEYLNNCGGEFIKIRDTSLDTFLKHFRQLLKELTKENKSLPLSEEDIKSFNLEKLGIKFLNKETRPKHNLTKKEFDQLFKAKIKDKIVERKDRTGKKNIWKVFDAKELERSRDIFCLMTWLGGLRMKEYNLPTTILLEDENKKGKKKVFFYTSLKNKKPVENPVLSYAEILLKKYNYEIPKFDKTLNRQIYKSHLKEIFKQAGLDREIVKESTYNDETKIVKRKIWQEASPNFSRKTFMQILRRNKISRVDIKTFTGHSDPDITDAYTFTDTQHKRELIEHIKPE